MLKTSLHVGTILLTALAVVAGAQRTHRRHSPPRTLGGESLALSMLDIRPIQQQNALVESGIDKPLAVLVRDSASWDTLWRRIIRVPAPEPLPHPVPRVDFPRDMVVVYALGMSMPMGRFKPTLQRAVLHGDTVCVTVQVRRLADGGIANDGADYPVALAVTRNVGTQLQTVRRDVLVRLPRAR